MVINMDRRQKKTRQAIFNAFCHLLSKKDFGSITVGEIIERADIGRATFYAHFETKDFLLKELCEELFCHVFDSIREDKTDHRHIFECDGSDNVFLHLFKHIYKNDNNILRLLSCRNNELFLTYFRSNLQRLIENRLEVFRKPQWCNLPESFVVSHVAATFTQTVKWWVDNGMEQSPEQIEKYFVSVLN